TRMVSDNPFSAPQAAPPVTQASYAPAGLDTAARVDTLGRSILAANPQIGVRPMFRTIGAPQPEIFHQGTAEIKITEGLVRQCRSDAELAVVLCYELGKMVSERESLARPWNRTQERELPPDVRFPGDNGADRTNLAEL